MTQHIQPLVLNFVFPGKYVCAICLILCAIVTWRSIFQLMNQEKIVIYESLGIFIRGIRVRVAGNEGWASDVRGPSGKCGHWGMGRKLWAGQWGTWRKVWGSLHCRSLCVISTLTVFIVMRMNFFPPPSFLLSQNLHSGCSLWHSVCSVPPLLVTHSGCSLWHSVCSVPPLLVTHSLIW